MTCWIVDQLDLTIAVWLMALASVSARTLSLSSSSLLAASWVSQRPMTPATVPPSKSSRMNLIFSERSKFPPEPGNETSLHAEALDFNCR